MVFCEMRMCGAENQEAWALMLIKQFVESVIYAYSGAQHIVR